MKIYEVERNPHDLCDKEYSAKDGKRFFFATKELAVDFIFRDPGPQYFLGDSNNEVSRQMVLDSNNDVSRQMVLDSINDSSWFSIRQHLKAEPNEPGDIFDQLGIVFEDETRYYHVIERILFEDLPSVLEPYRKKVSSRDISPAFGVFGKKNLCILNVSNEELANLIKGYVNFGNIVHSAPNILNDPDYIKEKVADTLRNIGISIKEDISGFRLYGSVRLECSDDNGTYYMLCGMTHDCTLDAFVVSLGPLRKVVEDLDPFSVEEDLVLTSELVDAQNKAYIKAHVLNQSKKLEIENGGDNDPLKGIDFKE